MICEGPGTCVPECELYGSCHCGCGQEAPRAPQSQTAKQHVRGRPYRYVFMHHPQQPAPQASKCWVPYEKARGMVEAIRAELGYEETAAYIGISTRSLDAWRAGHNTYLKPSTFRKLQLAYDRMDTSTMTERLPMSTLRDFLATRGSSIDVAFRENKTFRRYAYRPTTNAIVADEMAIAAGFHPYEIWGDLWWSYEESA